MKTKKDCILCPTKQKHKEHLFRDIQHTPTPWSVNAMGYLCGPDSENILENHDNGTFIVRAVNVHEELVKQLKRMIELVKTYAPADWKNDSILPAQQTIAKAEGR
jgi:hypothetical protein